MALKAQYKLLHCTGAALCLASLVLFVLTDSTDTQAQSPLLGDALAVAGAFMYAACNVTQEKLLRGCPLVHHDRSAALTSQPSGFVQAPDCQPKSFLHSCLMPCGRHTVESPVISSRSLLSAADAARFWHCGMSSVDLTLTSCRQGIQCGGSCLYGPLWPSIE